jgi:hypothetical protein
LTFLNPAPGEAEAGRPLLAGREDVAVDDASLPPFPLNVESVALIL